jgi:hypothetical protein
MNDHLKAVEVLLVEDNPRDVELTLRSLKKRHLTNKVQVLLRTRKIMEPAVRPERVEG